MKYLKIVSSHGATVLSVMCAVFVCINFVNSAMSFYDHVYTKTLLLILCLLFFLNVLFLKKEGFLALPLVLLFSLLAAGEAFLCLYSFFDPYFLLFTHLFGQISALCLCLVCLGVSVSLTVTSQKKP